MEAPYIPHALPSQTVFDFFLNATIGSAISFRTLWAIFWLAKTSNKLISLATWLAVNPKLVTKIKVQVASNKLQKRKQNRNLQEKNSNLSLKKTRKKT